MNDFKKKLQEITTKRIDEKISGIIKTELKQLGEKTDTEQYKQQIEQRSIGIQRLLVNFDNEMEIVDKANNYKLLPTIPVNTDVEKCIDNIIAKTISRRLDIMYEETVGNEGGNSNKKQSVQILDRQIRIKQLLKQYTQNMELIETYREQQKQEKGVSKTI